MEQKSPVEYRALLLGNLNQQGEGEGEDGPHRPRCPA